MYCIEVKETYQKTINSKVYINFDLSRYYNDIEEVQENINSLQNELERMNIVQTRTFRESDKIAQRVEYHRPGHCGTLVRTTVVRKYNPPKSIELI